MTGFNGDRVLKIDLKGRRKIDIGGIIQIEVDVVAVHNAFSELDGTFRDEKGEVPPTQVAAYNRALWQFVRGLIEGAAAESNDAHQVNVARQIASQLSMTNGLEILARLSEEAQELKAFFEVKSPEKPSSRESTELRFST